MNATALRLASWLRDHASVERVHYPGLSADAAAFPFGVERVWRAPIADLEVDAAGGAVEHRAGKRSLFPALALVRAIRDRSLPQASGVSCR